MTLVLARPDTAADKTDRGRIEIGLLNNLSDAGLRGGERQIVDLLGAISGSHDVRLRFFSLPSISRGEAARAHIAKVYTDFAALEHTRLDGLIVTGCEPRARHLPEEAFWPELTAVVDWAEHNTRSTIWSCLAAHAAVLHLDGIERRPLAEKCTGLFRVERVGRHPLLDGGPHVLHVPHSRYNGLQAEELEAAGYTILTRGRTVGVDTFAKAWRSLFIYLQGHPEYDADALRREYRRDIVRFLDGTCETYPNMPLGYFDGATQARLFRFAEEAKRARSPALTTELPLPQGRRTGGAHAAFARRLFGNWLRHLLATAPATSYSQTACRKGWKSAKASSNQTADRTSLKC